MLSLKHRIASAASLSHTGLLQSRYCQLLLDNQSADSSVKKRSKKGKKEQKGQ
jgi:hypothetical protein